MVRRAPLALLLGVSFVLGARAPLAWCDDPPPKPAPTPDAPAEPKKEAPKKVDHDDTSIFNDWKIAKGKGIQHAKDRAAFWEGKGVSGKDLDWLAWLWDRGEVYDKAAAAWEKFLEWKPEDEKGKTFVEKNAKDAMRKLVTAHLWGKNYAGTVKVGEAFLAAYPDADSTKFVWNEIGRAHRLAGNDDKALEAFAKSAELKAGKSIVDIVDIHLLNGRVDEAKAAVAKYPLEGAAAAGIASLKAFLDLVGNDAPSLEKGVNVGTSDSAPTAWAGKGTAIYYWHMQLSNGVRRLRLFDAACKDVSNATTLALATYNKLNPITQKVEADMTPEKEVDYYRKLVNEEFPRDIPYTVVVPKEVIDGLGLKGEGSIVIVDTEGKLRWMRPIDADKYDLLATAAALAKFAAPPKKG